MGQDNYNDKIVVARGRIPVWMIADKLNVSERSLKDSLGKEINYEKYQKIINAINEIKEELKEKGLEPPH